MQLLTMAAAPVWLSWMLRLMKEDRDLEREASGQRRSFGGGRKAARRNRQYRLETGGAGGAGGAEADGWLEELKAERQAV